MRLARLMAPALAAAAAVSQVSAAEQVSAPERATQPRSGQYRTVLELVEMKAPELSDDNARTMHDIVVEELASGNDFCLGPEQVEGANSRRMLEQIAEGHCTFDRFDRAGATVSAAMSCEREDTLGSQVTIDGRIWAENADLAMSLEQDFGFGATRITVRARPARVGNC